MVWCYDMLCGFSLSDLGLRDLAEVGPMGKGSVGSVALVDTRAHTHTHTTVYTHAHARYRFGTSSRVATSL